MTVDVQDAKTYFTEYLERVELGEVIIVCRHNQPVAELRPVRAVAERKARVPGMMRGQIEWTPGAFEPMSPDEAAEFDSSVCFRAANEASTAKCTDPGDYPVRVLWWFEGT